MPFVPIRCAQLFRFGTAALCLIACSAPSAEPIAYDVVVRTELPHLEESLRYATVQERRCVDADELPSLFSAMRHPSLAGCSLVGEPAGGYRLACASIEAATGTARIDAVPGGLSGLLEVKMGGKNMRFSQRVEAVARGACRP